MKQKTGMQSKSGRMRVSTGGSLSVSEMSAGRTNDVRADTPRDWKSGRFAMGKGKSGKSDLSPKDAKKANGGLSSSLKYGSKTAPLSLYGHPVESVVESDYSDEDNKASLLGYIDGKNLGYIDEQKEEEARGTDKPVKSDIKMKDRNKKGSAV